MNSWTLKNPNFDIKDPRIQDYVFSPDAFTFPNDIYNYLQLQRRGFGFFGAGEDPKIHETVLANQKSILNHLLHKNTLQRIGGRRKGDRNPDSRSARNDQ